ncbi:MAG: DUF6545 domain-containing protein [Angustibacter sp.]
MANVIHGILAVLIFCWIIFSLHYLQRSRQLGALRLAMTALGLAEIAQTQPMARIIYELGGPGAATVFRHLCAVVLATAILDLLQCVQAQQYRRRIYCVGLGFLLILPALWIADAPVAREDPTIYPAHTWLALQHWLLYLGYLSFALMSAMWACQNQALHIRKNALDISLRIIAWGLGLGLIFTISNTFSVLCVFFLGSPPDILVPLTGLQSLGPSLLFIVLGLSWPRLYACRRRHQLHRHLRLLTPEWRRVMRGCEEDSLLRLIPGDSLDLEELQWRFSRVVTEIYDSYLLLNSHVDAHTLRQLRRELARLALTPRERNIALQYVCSAIGLRHRDSGAPAGPLVLVPQISARTLRDAAHQLLRATRTARRRRVRRAISHLEATLARAPQPAPRGRATAHPRSP